MSLPIMLTRKRLAADGADKGSLVGMGPEVGSKIVRPGEAFRTQVTLKGRRMLLHPLFAPGRWRTVRVG